MKTKFNLQLFANENNPTLNTQTTLLNDAVGKNDLSFEMKTFYKTSLLENSRAELFYNQFGMKQPLPKNGGKSVEWRKFDTFAKATTALTEGVTPDGNKINVTHKVAEIDQYGDYTTISDRLELEAVDPVIVSVTEEHGAQAGLTLDTLTRNVLLSEVSQVYRPGDVAMNALSKADAHKITSTLINKAVTQLKKMHTPKINGDYIAIIHPSVAFDLRESDGWLDAHKYAQPGEIYNGEIGKLHGVRFIETSEAPVRLAGASNAAVYHTFIFGKDAYGIVEPSAESLEVIVKQRGSAGTSDPLDQRSTVGWKASHGAIVLYEERIVDIQTGSTFSEVDTAN